jgi:hypothetical protein
VAHFLYYFIRFAAIALGLGCTAWSAYQSWQHNPWDFTGPLAAVSAAALFVFCEHAAKSSQWVHFGVLGLLGCLAAIISGSVVLERASHSQEARFLASRTDNLPRSEARKALIEAKEALAKAEAAASAECASGRGTRCVSLESRETEARSRVEEKRAKLVGLGAETAVNPVAKVLGEWADIFHRARAVAPAIWLELAAPALIAFGLAPAPRKEEPKPRKKVKRRKVKRAPSGSLSPSMKAAPAAPRLKLVAANDH